MHHHKAERKQPVDQSSWKVDSVDIYVSESKVMLQTHDDDHDDLIEYDEFCLQTTPQNIK